MIRSTQHPQQPEQAPPPVVRLYTVIEAADLLGVSRHNIYKRINAGELPTVELGDTRSKLRIRADDLQALIDGHTHGRGGKR